MIAYPFPPVTKSGTFRPAKFAKYLPHCDWQPYIITISPKSNDPIDETLSKDLPEDLEIIRIRANHPRPRDRFLNWLKRRRVIRFAEGSQNGNESQANNSAWAKISNIVLKVVTLPLSFIEYPPVDKALYWSLRIIPAAWKTIKEHDIKVIYTTSPPFSPLITALVLKQFTGLSWVVDFRDPWTTEDLRYGSTGWRLTLNKYIERYSLRKADIVIGVTPKWVGDLRHLAGELETSNKYYLITNGYDESDFGSHPLPELNNQSEIKISHIGSIYEGGVGVLLDGLKHVDPTSQTKLRIEIVGYMHPHDLEKLNNAPHLSNISYHPQRLSHEQSLEIMRNSHVLLLSLPFEYYPGKLFEYMRIGRPVLAVAPEGSAAELIEKAQIGCVVNRDDSHRLSEVLDQIASDYEGFVGSCYHPDWEYIHQFERRILTQKLGSLFDNLATN
jgi:glycosyltransferase involved in cell wall biosynthesis